MCLLDKFESHKKCVIDMKWAIGISDSYSNIICASIRGFEIKSSFYICI